MAKAKFEFDLEKEQEKEYARRVMRWFDKETPTKQSNLSTDKPVRLATDKQKWKMKQLGIVFDDTTTIQEASDLIRNKEDA